MNDSRGAGSSDVSGLREALPSRLGWKKPLQVFLSTIERQPQRDPTCNAYAIRDCMAFTEFGDDLLDDILALNGLTTKAKEVNYLYQLPSVLMISPEEARLFAAEEHEALILEEV